MKIAKISYVTIRQMRCLLGVMFALVVADGVISNFLVTNGLAQEWNMFLQALVSEEHFLLIKAACAFLVAIIMWDIYKKRPNMAVISSLCIVAIYTGVVYWNILAYVVSQV